MLTLLCLAFFALTDFVGGDMYYFVIILLGIFFLGFTISASSTESKIQLLEKEREKIKNSAKISKPVLGWVRWIFKYLPFLHGGLQKKLVGSLQKLFRKIFPVLM